MAFLAFGFSLISLVNFCKAALGLGFVIFVHELGHFLVAKWCGVRVERFSIGFGPVIWNYIRGETEYALSLIPFGGYVKMLGQDDIDPQQMASTDVAKDPRSYTAKSVPQRMAIISAGVIMNLITGTMMFGGALAIGLDDTPSRLGGIVPGSPAWVAGLQSGDLITKIDGHDVRSFTDITRRVTLAWEKIDLHAERADGTKFSEIIVPEKHKKESRSTIGVLPSFSLELPDNSKDADKIRITVPGSPAAKAGFKGKDLIVAVGNKPVKDFFEFNDALSTQRDKSLEISVKREGTSEPVKLKVAANPFRTLGIKMDIGQISAVRKGSPAEGKLRKGDKITHVESEGAVREIGLDLNPLELPEYLYQLHGSKVTLHVKREKSGDEPEKLKFELTPENRMGWSDVPVGEDSPLCLSAIGVTCYVLHTVLAIEPGSAADGKSTAGDQVKSAQLVLPEGAVADSSKPEITLEFGEKQRNWPYLFWLLQEYPQRILKLTITSGGTEKEVTIVPQLSKKWFNIERGFNFWPSVVKRRSLNPMSAVGDGVDETRTFIREIYTILYNLFTGRLSVKQMHGPVGIVGEAVRVSSQGFGQLLYFLAYLSINLAVLNFLPIPVLDGGHMVFLIYEGVMGKPPSEKVVILATWAGFILILSLMVGVLYLDLFIHAWK